MTVHNKTRQTILAENITEAKSLTDQSLGLLKYKTPTAMLIKTKFGIHTFFMKYPIDVIVLDKTNHVVKIKEKMQPNSLLFWNPKHNIVIELPAKTISNTKTRLYDAIILV